MKSFFTLMILSLTFTANAEILKCGFTEPFVSFNYNTATQVLVETNPEDSRKITGVTFQIKYAGIFLLKTKTGKMVAEIKLTNQGSDGMSENVYPYEAKYFDALGRKGDVLIGGCTSSLKPMVKDVE